MTTDRSRLFDVYRVHCFFCLTVVAALTPEKAHEQMEVHYSEAHAADIRSMLK